MISMIPRWLRLGAILLAAAAMPPAPARAAQAPTNGTIEFTANVRPAGGRPEPVRGVSFYLLRKSMAEIGKEAAQSEQSIDMDHFIDGLEVSPLLKAWMKKHRTVEFVGPAFTK